MAPRGVPQIEVKFDIDANGILSVSAADKGTGKSQQITITASSGLSKEEIERMKKDAEMHADEDKKKQEQIEHKNIADSMVYTAEKMLKENEGKISDEDKKAVEEKIEALKQVKDGDDHPAIKKAADELGDIAQKVGAKLYEKKPEDGGQPAGEEPKKDDGPIDAEFTEKKE